MSASTLSGPVTAPAPRHPTAARQPSRVVAGLWAVVRSTAALAAFFLLWELAPRAGLVDRTFLPPVSEVARRWVQLAADGTLAEHASASMVRSLSGLALAVAIGVPLGLLIGWYRVVADLLGPLLELFRNTAALALLPVFVLLLGIGETSKIAVVTYSCLWPVLLNTIDGVRGVDPALVRAARCMGLSSPQLFAKVVLPGALPTIFTGVRLATAYSILVLIAAEMVGAKAGLGYLINAAQSSFQIHDMYAGIVTISAIGLVLNQTLLRVERRFTRWRVVAGA